MLVSIGIGLICVGIAILMRPARAPQLGESS